MVPPASKDARRAHLPPSSGGSSIATVSDGGAASPQGVAQGLDADYAAGFPALRRSALLQDILWARFAA